jgi:hypothetical protein
MIMMIIIMMIVIVLNTLFNPYFNFNGAWVTHDCFLDSQLRGSPAGPQMFRGTRSKQRKKKSNDNDDNSNNNNNNNNNNDNDNNIIIIIIIKQIMTHHNSIYITQS